MYKSQKDLPVFFTEHAQKLSDGDDTAYLAALAFIIEKKDGSFEQVGGEEKAFRTYRNERSLNDVISVLPEDMQNAMTDAEADAEEDKLLKKEERELRRLELKARRDALEG